MKDKIIYKNLEYKNIIKNINMNFNKNSLTFISGPNKCGKTTLIKLLSGLFSLYNVDLSEINYKKLNTNAGFVIANENMSFNFNTLNQELFYVLDNLDIPKIEKRKKFNQVVKDLKLKEYLYDNPNFLDDNLKIKVLLARELLKDIKILFLDDITVNMKKSERIELIELLNTYKQNLTIVITTSNLNDTITGDYLYILNKGEIFLEGNPIDILKEDNILNRLGLRIPFMIDLSVKLNFYDLVSDIELNLDKMVSKLWK